MRILLLTQVVPNPPDSGPKIKTHYLLRYLAEHHEVTLVSFVRTAAEAAAARALQPLCKEIHTVPLRRSPARDAHSLLLSLALRRPFVMQRDASPALQRLVHELVAGGRFDLIHADQLNMAQFGLGAGPPLVLDEHNAVWSIVRRLAAHARGLKRVLLELEWRRLRRYEGAMCRASAAVMAVTPQDRALLLEAGAREPIPVIPIATDVYGTARVQRRADAHGILNFGTMFWPPNVDGALWFAREVLPAVRSVVPEALFYIVGARPTAAVRALDVDPAVQVTGYVEDPLPYLESSALLVVPLRAGGGMRVKILEALARGIPVVSTTIGAEGIDLRAGEHLLVADSPAAFAEAVTRILRDRGLAERLADAGRRHVEQHYDWRCVCPAIEPVYRRALGAFAPAGHAESELVSRGL